jgi:hypothetical protein
MKTNGELTKEEQKILNTLRVDGYNSSSIRISYPLKSYSKEKKQILTSNRQFTLNVTTSPTGNCQMASIISFNNAIALFNDINKEQIRASRDSAIRQGIDPTMYINMQKENKIAQKLAILKAFANLRTKVTCKRLFFIDIPSYSIAGYKKLHPFLFKRRNSNKEVPYISTNKHALMYSVIEIDINKAKRYI